MKRANGKAQIVPQSSGEGSLPMWTPNSIIRHRTSGRALLVVHVYRNCTIVVDIENKDELVTPMALLIREYHNYAREEEMTNDDPLNYSKDWHYHYIDMK